MFNGHINIGKRLTIYGDNAMHWGITFWTKKYGYVCFRLPFKSCGKWWPLYFYCSPDATPDVSTFMLGRKAYPDEWVKSRIRLSCFGHNFNPDEYDSYNEMKNYEILRGINRLVDHTKWTYAKYQRDNQEKD